MLKTNGGNFTETHKKSNSHCCRYDSRRRQEKDGVANQMTEYELNINGGDELI